MLLNHYNIKKYLKNNYSEINLYKNNSFSDLSIIDSDLLNKEIFLTGENHGIKANVKLKMKFLKYFKQKTNFKYYLCELPYTVSYFLNIFLKTGNKHVLKEAYKPLAGTDAWNKDDYNHWKELYKFNNTLPNNKKIKVVGVDVEHQLKSPYKYMSYIVNKGNTNRGNIPKQLKCIIKEFKFLVHSNLKINDDRVKKFYKKLNKTLIENDEICRQYLGKDYFGFKFVSNNLLNGYKSYVGNNFNGVRDKKIYENFILLNKTLPKGKYFGQWGLSHIFQTPSPIVKWFGASLNSQNSIFKNKVLSIAYIYNNCKYLYPTIRKNYISSINTLKKELHIFNQFIKGSCTIFKLNNKNSPFNKELIWPIDHIFPKKGVTTDYFQYIVIVQNSDAVDKFKD